MAELNLKQIIDSLNEEFTGDTRKLVFWYVEGIQMTVLAERLWGRYNMFIL